MPKPHSLANAPWWRRALDLEPVLVANLVRALIVAAAAFGLTVPDHLEGWVVGAFVAVAAAFEAGLTIWTRLRATPTAKVVEQVDPDTGTVTAGPANDLADLGKRIRTITDGTDTHHLDRDEADRLWSETVDSHRITPENLTSGSAPDRTPRRRDLRD